MPFLVYVGGHLTVILVKLTRSSSLKAYILRVHGIVIAERTGKANRIVLEAAPFKVRVIVIFIAKDARSPSSRVMRQGMMMVLTPIRHQILHYSLWMLKRISQHAIVEISRVHQAVVTARIMQSRCVFKGPNTLSSITTCANLLLMNMLRVDQLMEILIIWNKVMLHPLLLLSL
jgi:hypothetical protein